MNLISSGKIFVTSFFKFLVLVISTSQPYFSYISLFLINKSRRRKEDFNLLLVFLVVLKTFFQL